MGIHGQGAKAVWVGVRATWAGCKGSVGGCWGYMGRVKRRCGWVLSYTFEAFNDFPNTNTRLIDGHAINIYAIFLYEYGMPLKLEFVLMAMPYSY